MSAVSATTSSHQLHAEFWKKLTAVGNDPFPYSAMRTPSLVFENVSIAGV